LTFCPFVVYNIPSFFQQAFAVAADSEEAREKRGLLRGRKCEFCRPGRRKEGRVFFTDREGADP
jgi:hypothetical protein